MESHPSEPANVEKPRPPACFTAAQIARALGMTKRGLLHALRGVEPSSTLIVSGNAAGAWPICSLPVDLQELLEGEAARRGYRNAEWLLAHLAEVEPWKPKVPPAEVSPKQREKAENRKVAYAPSFVRMNDLGLSEAEFERLGVEDYRRIFGRPISASHWKKLFNRIVARDGGAEAFDRVELYLDENAGKEDAARAGQPAAHDANAHLLSEIAEFRNPTAPSADEVAYLWCRSFEHFEAEIAMGKRPKKVKRLLLDFLLRDAPFLADSAAGLRMQFDRKFKKWTEGGRIPAAVADRRPEESGWFRAPAMSDEDKDNLVGRAALKCGGRVAQAWRALRQSNGLSAGLDSHYLDNPTSKSYVPRHVRDAVKYEVALLYDIHHGQLQHDLGAYLDRAWDCVPAGDWYQADDCTLPVYYYEEDGKGWYTLWRGQFLPMVDLRSRRILSYALLSSRSYNSLAIRTVITRACDEHGLPRKGFYFERGIWKSSKILKGSAGEAALSLPEAERGLKDLGLQFIHAKRAPAKPIEGILGQFQNLMEGDLGYIGRNEQIEKFERVQKAKLQVESGKLRPEGVFYSAQEWLARLDQICEQYNAEPQDGKMTGGLSPDEAHAKFRNTSDHQIKFDASCRYLLAHHKRPVRVGRNGITLRFGKNVFNYRNEETGRLIGQTVLAWFNPELPEILCVTDMDRKNPFSIERSQSVPAMGAPDELLAQELRRIAAHQSHAKVYYRTLKAKFAPEFRRNVVAPDVAELGDKMQRQQEAAQAGQRRKDALKRRMAKVRVTSADLEAACSRDDVPVTLDRVEAAEELTRILFAPEENPRRSRETPLEELP